jgi:hypothetical protein
MIARAATTNRSYRFAATISSSIRRPKGSYLLFLTSRSIRHYFSGFLHVPPGGDPAKFFEFTDKPPTQRFQYAKDWYFVANERANSCIEICGETFLMSALPR